MFDVITVGSAVYDGFLEGDFATEVYKKSVSQKAFVLPLGEKLSGKRISFETGGNAVNAAVTFSRQGYRTGTVIRLGRDIFGKEILSRLKKEKIDVRFAETDNKLQTSSSTILLSSGERTIINFPAAGQSLSLGKFLREKPKSKWLYLSLPGESCGLFPRLLTLASKTVSKIALNPTGYHIKHAKQTIADNLSKIDFLVLNETEASMLTGIDFKQGVEAFQKLDRMMPGILAVTYGRSGAIVSDGRLIYEAKIFKDQKVIDRTGAGDAFGSGFVAGLMRKQDIKEAIRLGMANAASVVEVIGANKGALHRSEFEENKRWSKITIKTKEI